MAQTTVVLSVLDQIVIGNHSAIHDRNTRYAICLEFLDHNLFNAIRAEC